MEPVEHREAVNGIEISYFEWGSEHRASGPTLLFAHATGFHARCWDPVIRLLGERHMITVDQRGHGRSERTPITHWECFGRDLAGLVAALDLTRIVGIGHSMGGHAMVDAAAAMPERFSRLVLVDPVIAAPDAYGGGGWAIDSLAGEQHPAAKRKRRFDSPAEMIDRFRDRDPYRVFHPDALTAYCTHGLLPAADGAGYELACPPEIEASVYMTSRTNAAIHESIESLELPVLILRAKLPPQERSVMDFASSPTWPGLVHRCRNAREIHFAEHTHFLPMEIPRLVAELISEEADRACAGTR